MDAHERTALERALRGLDYPAPRSKLVTLARENGASRELLDLLLALPETADFQNAADLHEALGISVPGERPSGGWE